MKADQFTKAATHLGRGNAVFSPPLTIRRTKGENRRGRLQKACTGCGRCCSGCPENAKNTLDLNYLAHAEDCGARVRTLCEVVGIEELPDGLWRVEATDHIADGNKAAASIEAETVAAEIAGRFETGTAGGTKPGDAISDNDPEALATLIARR